MPTILLTGSSADYAPVVDPLRASDTSCTLLSIDPEGKNSHEGIEALTSWDDLPEVVDGVILVAPRNDGTLEAALAGVMETNRLHAVPLFLVVPFVTATEVSAMLENLMPVWSLGAIGGFHDLSTSIEAAPSLQMLDDQRKSGSELLTHLFKGELLLVEDRVGLVSLRIIAMVVNEASFALLEKVAGADDIDTAMTLGTGYPHGPLAWCDTIGVDIIVDLLHALQDEYGEERYRPSVLLKQYLRADLPFHRTESVDQ